MTEIRLSQDPEAWVNNYLNERAKMELGDDYEIQPALDPQFNFYAVPKIRSYVSNTPDLKARHVLIVVTLKPADVFGSAEEQLLHIHERIKPVFEEDYFIYEYDTDTGWGELYLSNDERFLMRLVEGAIVEDMKDKEEDADGDK